MCVWGVWLVGWMFQCVVVLVWFLFWFSFSWVWLCCFSIFSVSEVFPEHLWNKGCPVEQWGDICQWSRVLLSDKLWLGSLCLRNGHAKGCRGCLGSGWKGPGVMLLCSSVAVPVPPDEVMVTQPSEKRKPEGNPLQEGPAWLWVSAASVNYTSSLESRMVFKNHPPTPWWWEIRGQEWAPWRLMKNKIRCVLIDEKG